MFKEINDYFWDVHFWIPEEFTWDDFNQDTPRSFPSDIYVTPFIAVFFLIVRYFFESLIAVPFCLYLGIGDPKSQPEAEKICEKYFQSSKATPDAYLLKEISTKTGWSTGKCNRWFQKRSKRNYSSLLKKSSECCWRFLAYLCMFLFGCYILVPTGWIFNVEKCFVGFIKHQEVTFAFKAYYMLEMGFYMSLLYSQFYDTKRKDFMQLFAHHIMTIVLLAGSYVIGHYRIGSLIMLLHDASDYWLEAAKVANYAKYQRLCDGLFVVFAITFFMTRWVYYAVFILYTWMKYNDELVGHLRSFFTAPYLLLLVNFLLFGLHIYWGFLIGKMVYKFTVAGKVEKDTRSDDDTDDSDDNDIKPENSNKND